MNRKTAVSALAASLLTMALAVPAFAATEYEEITDLSFDIASTLEVGVSSGSEDYIDVTLETDGCDVTSVTVTNEPSGGWDWDSKPKVKIIVEANDDYRFMSGLGKDDVYVPEEEGEVTSVTRSSNRKISVTVTLVPIEDTENLDDEDYTLDIDPENIGWDAYNRGSAYWDSNEYAKYYEVKIYRDGTDISPSGNIRTTDNYLDLSAYFKGAGEYTFRVRAVRNKNNEGDWARSPEQTVTDQEAADIYAQRTNDGYQSSDGSNSSSSSQQEGAQHNRGSVYEAPGGEWANDGKGTWWKRLDGTWPASQWSCIGGLWYWFDENGYRSENEWEIIDGLYYYLGAGGAMLSNTYTPDRYWVGENGAWDGKQPAAQ